MEMCRRLALLVKTDYSDVEVAISQQQRLIETISVTFLLT